MESWYYFQMECFLVEPVVALLYGLAPAVLLGFANGLEQAQVLMHNVGHQRIMLFELGNLHDLRMWNRIAIGLYPCPPTPLNRLLHEGHVLIMKLLSEALELFGVLSESLCRSSGSHSVLEEGFRIALLLDGQLFGFRLLLLVQLGSMLREVLYAILSHPHVDCFLTLFHVTFSPKMA